LFRIPKSIRKAIELAFDESTFFITRSDAARCSASIGFRDVAELSALGTFRLALLGFTALFILDVSPEENGTELPPEREGFPAGCGVYWR
jgi:hypothetical protein